MKDAQILYPSAVTTADHNIDFTTSAKGGYVVIDVTLDAAAASVVFTIQGVDTASDSTWDILASAAVNALGTRVLRVYPGLTAAANLTVSDVLPQAVRIKCDHADADAITYSVGFIGVD
jgi:hypothetical protein